LSDKVLIVDDDIAVLQMLGKVICSDGMSVEKADNGQRALQLLDKNDYALMLLDINMSGIDGFEVIDRVRKKGLDIPIIVVSGRKEDIDTLYALKIGADDYITKPFNPVTLGAKVKALIRRSQSTESEKKSKVSAGPFAYDCSTLRLYKNGAEIELTSKENAIMKLFLDNVNRVFTKETIYEIIWGNSVVDDNAIMVYINRLRQKIEDVPSEPHYIQTVRGLGYRFEVKERN